MDQNPDTDGEPRVWVLLDTAAGHRSQALGVADALGQPYETKSLAYGWAANLPNALLGATFATLTPKARTSVKIASYPDLIIAAGRRTAPISRAIRKASRGRTKLVQIMDPGAGRGDFDLIAVPHHDTARVTENMIEVNGAPHGITPEVLEAARERWRAVLEPIAGPRIAVIVGGNTRRRLFTTDMGREMAKRVRHLAESKGARLLITTSRRSGHGGAAFVGGVRDLAEHLFLWGDKGDNPYHGYLAWADEIVVTGESVSMCAEACGVGAPVHIFAPPALITPKHARMLQGLCDDGLAQPLGGDSPPMKHPPFNPAHAIAEAIRSRVVA